MKESRASTTIEAGLVLADPAKAELASNVRIQVVDGRISALVGGGADNGLVGLPAMANAHDHGFGIRPLAFGCGDDCLECWIPGLAARPQTDPQLETEVAFGRMALAGIGSTMHCHNSLLAHRLEREAVAVRAAADNVGLRVGFSCPIVDDNAWVYGGPEKLRPLLSEQAYQQLSKMRPPAVPAKEQVSRVAEIARELAGPGFSVQYGPIGPQWCKAETLEAISEASATEGLRVHMHLLESRRQREWLDQAHSGGVVRMLDSIGLLSPRLTVAHGVWLDDDDCEILAERGVTVATNPACNLRLRSGVAPLARFARHGVAVAVGTDGLSLNDNQDYLTDLRLARNLHRGTGLEDGLPAGPFLKAALENGFRTVCNESGYGVLAKGAHADVLLLDFDSMGRDMIVDDPDLAVGLLLGRMSSAHVRHLHVAGREVVREGRLCGLDFEAAESELVAQAKAGASHAGEGLGLIGEQREATRDYYAQNENIT